MTINNRDWLRKTVMRLYLSGLPQEEIALETGASEGTVNAVIKDAVMLDNTMELQRNVALVAKRTGISVQTLASALAVENSIKRQAFEQGKIHSILKAIDNAFTQDGRLEPELVGKIFLQITDLMLKNNTTLEELPSTLQSNYDELNNLKGEIKNRKRGIRELHKRKIDALAADRTTQRELNHAKQRRKCFEQVGLDFEKEDEVKNVLTNIQEMNFDATNLINELKEIRGLKKATTELQENISILQSIVFTTSEKIRQTQTYMGHLGPTQDIIINYLQRGVHRDIIISIFDMASKHPPAFLENLPKDIDTYGGIEAAIFYKRTEYNFLIDSVANLEAQRNAWLNNNNYNNNVTDYTNATRQNDSADQLI